MLIVNVDTQYLIAHIQTAAAGETGWDIRGFIGRLAGGACILREFVNIRFFQFYQIYS